MSKRRGRPVFLNRTDHRLDMSPAGRNLFVSRDKQAQHRSVRRIKLWMRVVAVLAGLAVLLAVGLVAVYGLAPWFREELTLPSSSQVSSQASQPPVAVQEYDELGLPIYKDEVNLFVVNEDSPVLEAFFPALAEAEGVQVDARIVPALKALSDAAREEGLALVFTEGYVSYGEQKKRFDAQVEKLEKERGLTAVMAKVEARSLESAPGECDFQSGMCVRLDGDPKSFGDSRTYSWLKTNMGKYGFIFRYPEDKEDYTGREPDLTVIRYVGAASAAAMQQRSMCLEEYLDYLASQ